MTHKEAAKRIEAAVLAWPGIEAGPHQFGAREYRLRTREIGHVHGDEFVDIPLPKRVRDEVVEAREAEPHHVLPNTGWVTVFLRQEKDVDRAIRLLRRSYEIALAQTGRETPAN